jgi:hypothetical protein
MEYDTSEFQSSEIHDRNKAQKRVVGTAWQMQKKRFSLT